MKFLYNKSGRTIPVDQWDVSISDNEIIVLTDASRGRVGIYFASQRRFITNPALMLDKAVIDRDFRPAFTSAHDFGTVTVAGVKRYRFKIRRKCRVFHPSGGLAFSLYAGDEVCVAGVGNTGSDMSKLAIRGYKKAGGSWVSVASGTQVDTDIEIGYCNMKNSTVYGTGY